MATVLENLQTRKVAIAEILASGEASKPTYSIDGQSVQWESYRMSLLKELADLNDLINLMDPYEIQTNAV